MTSGTITLTALGQSVTYGTAPNTAAILGTTYSFSCSDGCSSSVLTGGPTIAISGGTGLSTSGNRNVGSWTIGLSGATDSNGDPINYATGALTINAKSLTPGLTGTVGKTYDGTTTATLAANNYTLAGVVSGVNNGGGTSDTVSVSTTAGTYDTKDAGTGKTVSVSGLAITGADAGDYILASSSTSKAVGTITAKDVTITGVTGANKVYDTTTGDAPNNSGEALSGVIAADISNVTITNGTGTFADANVGTGKTVSFSGYGLAGSASADYTLTVQPTNSTANITQAALTVTSNACSR